MKKVKYLNKKSYRLVNSKFPPITLFDDVADADDFEAIYALQALTNPRIQNELGDLSLLPTIEIPFGIKGTNYVTAPFTHMNPDGSRFSDGSFGVLYLADTEETAIAETLYHQEKYFQGVKGLHYDTLDMRCLAVVFSGVLFDAKATNEVIHGFNAEQVYDPNDYRAPQALGAKLLNENIQGVEYSSVRNKGAICWALFSPKHIKSAVQTKHFEFIYDGKRISHVRELKTK